MAAVPAHELRVVGEAADSALAADAAELAELKKSLTLTVLLVCSSRCRPDCRSSRRRVGASSRETSAAAPNWAWIAVRRAARSKAPDNVISVSVTD